jgi:hypothetical protein
MLSSRTLLMGAALALAACNSPQDKMKEAEAARIEADKKVAEVTAETSRKAAEVQHKAAEETARIAQEGAKKIDAVDDVASKKIAEASDALMKARTDLRDTTAKKLENLDKDVVELRAKLEKKISKAESDKVMADLKTRSELVRKSIAADLDAATPDSFASVKKTIEIRIADLDKAIADVKKRV